jgi:hypothetical protein
MGETVHEDDERNGGAVRLTVTARIGPDTALRVSLPGDDLPFVLRVGRVAGGMHLYAERAELERLHAIIGRALDQHAGDRTTT